MSLESLARSKFVRAQAKQLAGKEAWEELVASFTDAQFSALHRVVMNEAPASIGLFLLLEAVAKKKAS